MKSAQQVPSFWMRRLRHARYLIGTALATGMLSYATVAQATAIYTFDVGDVVTVGQATPFATMTVSFSPSFTDEANLDIKAAPGYAFSDIFLNVNLTQDEFHMTPANGTPLIPGDLVGYQFHPGVAIVTPFGSMNAFQQALGSPPLMTEALIGVQNLTGPWTDESTILAKTFEGFVASLTMFDLSNDDRKFNAADSSEPPVCEPSCTREETNVPEPSSVLVLLAGLFGLGFTRKIARFECRKRQCA